MHPRSRDYKFAFCHDSRRGFLRVSFSTYQLGGHSVAGPERQVVSYGGALAPVLLQAGTVLRQTPWIDQTMEVGVAFGRDVHDYRLARALDLHGARDRRGRWKIREKSGF